jgi:cytochrome P450
MTDPSSGHRSRDRPGSFEKDRAFFGLSQRKGPHIIVANDDDHRRFRRLQSHAFSEKALLTQQDVINVHLDKFIRQLRNRAANSSHLRTVEGHSGIVNVVRWLNCLMFDTIGDLAFGSSFNSLDAGGDRYMDVIFSLIKAGNYLRAARRFVPFVQQLLTIFWIPKKLLEDQKFLRKVSDARVKERLEAGTERGDFSNCLFVVHLGLAG